MILEFPILEGEKDSKKSKDSESLLLSYIERIEFKNYQMFEAFFWNMPDFGIKSGPRDLYNDLNVDRRDLYGFDEPQNARARRNDRARRTGVLYNNAPLVPQQGNLDIRNVEHMNPT